MREPQPCSVPNREQAAGHSCPHHLVSASKTAMADPRWADMMGEEEEATMQILVMNLDRFPETITLNIKSSETIDSVKVQIQEQGGLSAPHLRQGVHEQRPHALGLQHRRLVDVARLRCLSTNQTNTDAIITTTTQKEQPLCEAY